MGSNTATSGSGGLLEPMQPPIQTDPTIHALANCLEELETEAMLLGRNLTALLIGSARLALHDQ